MNKWEMFYKGEFVGVIWFTPNTTEDDMFRFVERLGISVGYFIRVNN